MSSSVPMLMRSPSESSGAAKQRTRNPAREKPSYTARAARPAGGTANTKLASEGRTVNPSLASPAANRARVARILSRVSAK